jgi:hypothetical protein
LKGVNWTGRASIFAAESQGIDSRLLPVKQQHDNHLEDKRKDGVAVNKSLMQTLSTAIRKIGGAVYRLIFSNSARISSLVVMTFELA